MATHLVDSGSATTFISLEMAKKAQCNISSVKKLQVNVANGEKLWTKFTCSNTSYKIQGEQFTYDSRILNLGGYDIILGAD